MSQNGKNGDGRTPSDEAAEDGSELTLPGAAEEGGSGATLPPNPDLEEALRAATEAVEARESQREAGEEKPPELSALEEELSSLREQYDDLERQHLRLQADFDNVRRRAMKDRQEAHNYGHEGVVRDLLVTVDNLERAIEHARAKPGDAAESELPNAGVPNAGVPSVEAIIEGVELVHRELVQVLERHHVTPVDALGQVFDPSVHEAMAQHESAEAQPNTVVQVFARGYLLHDRLLRPAKVIVSKAVTPPAETAEEPSED